MPLVGFKCPEFGEEPGRDNKVDYCITQCSNPCVAPNLLASMLELEKDDSHGGKIISVTMLTGGCYRQTLLEKVLPYYLEPDKKLPTFRGTLVHLMAEQAADIMREKYGWLVEKRLLLPCSTTSGSWTLSGTLDAYDPLEHRLTIYDIKTIQDFGLQLLVEGRNKGEWSQHISEHYIKQINLYRYMGKKLDLFEAKKLRLQFVTLKHFVSTGTTKSIGFKKGFKWSVDQYDVPEVPIIDDEIVESWIQMEGDHWYRVLFLGEFAPVVNKEWSWLCKNCVFKGTRYCPDPDKEREEGAPNV